jgi:hypothetical protein
VVKARPRGPARPNHARPASRQAAVPPVPIVCRCCSGSVPRCQDFTIPLMWGYRPWRACGATAWGSRAGSGNARCGLGKSTWITVGDVRAMVRLAGELGELRGAGVQRIAWVAHLLGGACRLTGSAAASHTVAEGWHPNGEARLVSADVARFDDDMLRRTGAFVRTREPPDPIAHAATAGKRDAAGTGSHAGPVDSAVALARVAAGHHPADGPRPCEPRLPPARRLVPWGTDGDVRREQAPDGLAEGTAAGTMATAAAAGQSHRNTPLPQA